MTLTAVDASYQPVMDDAWYRDFYAHAPHSPAHAAFCRRVYGWDLCQTGWADMTQLRRMLAVTDLQHGERALDLGCGLGLIAEYLSDTTQAQVTGLDNVPVAIEHAQERTRVKKPRLAFRLGDYDALPRDLGPFELIVAIDTLHRPRNLDRTLERIAALLAPGGQVAVFYSHTVSSAVSGALAGLQPDRTPLARALLDNGLPFEAWDWTEATQALALTKQRAAEDLRLAFAAEGNCFLYEHLAAEGQAVAEAIAGGRHARYLYLASGD
jgi:SAM-dependent methyltransferase